MNTAEDQEVIEFEEGELTHYYRISPFYPLKKSFPLLVVIGVTLALYLFGGDNFYIARANLMDALGWSKPLLYYFACTALLLMVGYWYLYIHRFAFGVNDGMVYIRKGALVQDTFDYPITSIENIAIKRDFLDVVFSLCTIQIMTAHESSDDLAAIRGLSHATGRDVHRFLRELVKDHQSSRHDIRALQQEVASVRAQNSSMN